MEGAPKQFLYHMVPKGMKPDENEKKILYPLNMLKEKFPELYEVAMEKYDSSEYRRGIPKMLIPTLEEASWGDVLQLTAIHPEELRKALVEAGLHPEETEFYEIDPNSLDPKNTTVFLYREDVEDESPDNFAPYDPAKLAEHSPVPESTKEYYRERSTQGGGHVLFVGVPHIFHKGPIDVSKFKVIIA